MRAHRQGCDLISIMEMWWDGSYDWSVGMEGQAGEKGRGCHLYIRDQLECIELPWGWVRSHRELKGQD